MKSNKKFRLLDYTAIFGATEIQNTAELSSFLATLLPILPHFLAQLDLPMCQSISMLFNFANALALFAEKKNALPLTLKYE